MVYQRRKWTQDVGCSIGLEIGKKLREILVFENKEPQFCHPMNSYGTPPVIMVKIVPLGRRYCSPRCQKR